MKALSAVLGGFVLTLAVFASGLAFAVWILSAEPVRQAAPTSSVAELWPREPRKVDPASQRLERLPARELPELPVDQVSVDRTSKPVDAAASAPDSTATASIKPAADEQQELPAAHVEWCASRYRSYRPGDDHYTSYSGEQRPCISPYIDAGAAKRVALRPDESASYVEATDTWSMDGNVSADETGGAWLPPDHVQYCFNRYRSYRPEDNTYQPYSGGPRRQCE
ncbi:MAG: BA14K family protein [Mesorhizobium sp.]|uniref:BA14K family protein n=1 Tax=unclassified Mesorhizobium TaxID=325217 RepID=UPI000FCA48DB|nr:MULTISPECIES: BA14K family protein [unclassified Mesorhizobium]RUV71672.1 BA14K family protein [Mesorhizobium sp. M5C.F.Cr.IN.023.01.1.1]RWF88087.1 MAG: BA14K family protein [Mesorhizobium sp.]RWF91996.1 MAG: BA14K family protein [Mesorhizobium sp.]RWI42711.1 MAG: BA14K family protein [Mesorhizobium sp.]RWI53227.1 MAG: BA14K family protein [Mesorhizobium sp.]